MLRIGEIANFCSISIKALRYYDNIGLFKPKYIDPETNYRYYDEEQIKKLNLIIDLKLIGLSLNDVIRVMKNGINEPLLLELLSKQRKECENNIQAEELKIDNIDTISKKLQESSKINDHSSLHKELYDERLSRLVSLDSVDSNGRHDIEDAIWL